MSNWIEQQYMEERKRAEMEQVDNERLLIPTSIRLPLETVAYFTALSKRFSQSRNSTMSEMLSEQVQESFKTLSMDDRLLVGKHADIELKELYKKNGGEYVGIYYEHMAQVFNDAESSAKK